jgi:hypothetical protein
VAHQHDSQSGWTPQHRHTGPAFVQNRIAHTNAVENLSHPFEGNVSSASVRRRACTSTAITCSGLQELERTALASVAFFF